MPEIRYYEVEQTRVVRVRAGSLVNAVRIASVAFDRGQTSDGRVLVTDELSGVSGDTITLIKETDLTARLDV